MQRSESLKIAGMAGIAAAYLLKRKYRRALNDKSSFIGTVKEDKASPTLLQKQCMDALYNLLAGIVKGGLEIMSWIFCGEIRYWAAGRTSRNTMM